MYTIKQASLRTGVSIPLLRAWERRYGVPVPDRTASGYRLYGDDAIAQLRAMRQLVDEGWSPSQAALEVQAGRLPQASPVPLRSSAPSPEPPAADLPAREQRAGGATAMIGRVVAAARNLDDAALEAALGDAMLTGPFEAVVATVWLPAMVAVGRAWESGDLDVASEHAASGALLRRLGAAYEAAGRAAARADVLVGLPPGSRHELGALAFAVAGRRAGLNLLYLGPDVPAESWLRAADETGARAAIVGVVTDADRDPAREVLLALASSRPAPFLRFVGGGAAKRDEPLPAIVLPDEPADAVAAVRQALRSID